MIFDDTPKHNITNAVIYCRVSSKSQSKKGDGLNSQETRCKQYAKYKKYNVAKVFKDDVSGTLSDRPGLLSMLSFLQADRKNPHVVIIDDLSRFARSVPVHFEFREAITKAGGVLESPSVILRDDADGELHEYILTSVAQHQARKNAETVRNRMKARVWKGYSVFHAAVGYKYMETNDRGKVLVRDEPLATIIQEALEGFASGRFSTQTEVKRYLESQPDFPKDLPEGLIRQEKVFQMLKRVTYAGYIEVPKWGISLRKAKHEGLISFETHLKIQDRLNNTNRLPSRKDLTDDFILRGFVKCNDCQKPLTAGWSKSCTGKRYPYYLCQNRQCESKGKSIPRDKLEGEFAKLLQKLQPSRKLFDITQAMFRKAWDTRLEQASLMKATMQRDVTKIEKQIEQLVDRIVDCKSETAIAAYEKRIAKLDKEKLMLAEKLKNQGTPQRTFEEMFELAIKFLSSPYNIWKNGRLEDKRTVLKLAFAERLTYDRKEGYRTPQVTVPFEFLGFFDQKCKMVPLGRIERSTIEKTQEKS
jgi:DNA invertase Pin-like site-specific DNA recombinase